jgi:hypothetical protein
LRHVPRFDVGMPLNCGFYPGSHSREPQSGTCATFDEARADFGKANSDRLSFKRLNKLHDRFPVRARFAGFELSAFGF